MESAIDITLCSKQSADAFRAQNAAFLAEYNTDDKQIDYYTQLAMRVFEEFDIDGSFTFEGVRKNVKVWYENKSAQMQLFRKHPYWSEKHKAIMFLHTESRGADYALADNKFRNLLGYVYSHYRPSDKWDSGVRIFGPVLDWAKREGIEANALLNEQIVKCWLRNCDTTAKVKKPMKPGAKISRVVRQWFSEMELEDGSVVDATTLVDECEDRRTAQSFEKFYAAFTDSLSELTTEKTTIVSLHFCDFMTMSNGNSWSSCHFINSNNIFHTSSASSYRGEYKNGCLSYALDKPSFILYTLPSECDSDEYYRVQKLTRMCCQYENGLLVTGKAYPSNNSSIIQRYRQIMQFVISQCESMPNPWSFSTDIKKVRAFTDTADNSCHYPDYDKEAQRPTISMCLSPNLDIGHRIVIGHESYCLHCGKTHTNSNWLQCEDHRVKMVCKHCGKRLDPNKAHKKYEGNYYCDDCLFMCEYHKRYEPISEARTIETDNGTMTICNNAARNFVVCSDCGLYHNTASTTRATDGGHLCAKCVKKYKICYSCNRAIVGDSHKLGRNTICDDCNLMSEGKMNIVKRDRYNVGDYVLMADDVSGCHYGANAEMRRYYPGRVVKITEVPCSDAYRVSPLDGDTWGWSSNCFAGKIMGANDEMIGKTINEIKSMFKRR